MHLLSKSQAVKLPAGTVIIGKWNRNRYQVVKKLGSGAIGVVYLVQSKRGLAALKIGFDRVGIVSEMNVLKQFTPAQGKPLGPYFIEMDDWVANGFRTCFYVMEYIRGKPLTSFLQLNGVEWIEVLILQLLNDLHQLHSKGWVFGDLKPDNLLVTPSPPQIRWLDVGGTTQIGRSIKEYTEFFDRGYWGLGSRKAEPSYDLFSVAMIFINAAYPKRFKKQVDAVKLLEQKIDQSPLLKKHKTVIMKAVRGDYSYALDMRKEMIENMNSRFSNQKVRSFRRRSQKNGQKKRNGRWTETLLLVAFFLFVYLLYLFGNVF